MSVHVLRCPNCGADLDVADGLEVIRCKFCGARCRMDWRGANPVLAKEAQEIADALAAIDFDELERDLSRINAMMDENDHRRSLLDAANERIGTDEQLDQMALRVVASGNAEAFLAGIENMGDHGGDPVTLMGQNLAHRLAMRVRRAQAAQPLAPQSVRLTREAPRPDFAALAVEEAATAELIRKLKLWRWLPWAGLVLVPILVVGLAVIVTVVLAMTLPKESKGQWLTWLLAAGLFGSPVLGLVWLWFGLRRKKSLIRALSQ